MTTDEASSVTVIVSDPWEFPDENEGRLAFVASIVGDANGQWLPRFIRPVTYEGRVWNFAIPITRHVGQTYFDGDDKSAKIVLITDEQAASETFLEGYGRMVGTGTPFLIGSVERGIAKLIPSGEDSFVEPTWTPKK